MNKDKREGRGQTDGEKGREGMEEGAKGRESRERERE